MGTVVKEKNCLMGINPFPYFEKGQKLRELRGNKKKKEFADLLETPYRTYLRYETGEREVPDGLLKLARMIGQGYAEAPDGHTDSVVGSVGLDKETLQVVIEATEIALTELKLKIKPDKKAELIVMLYEMYKEGKEVDRPTLLRLVKLAA